MNTRVLTPLVCCSALLLSACSSQVAAAATSAANANQHMQASPPVQLQSSQPRQPGLAPLADWYTAWSGTPGGDGWRRVTGADHPLVSVMFMNAGQKSKAWDFDLFVLSAWPGREAVNSTVAFDKFAGQVWDWRRANSGTAHTVTVDAGSRSTIQLDWAYSTLTGQPAPNGRYFVFLTVSHSGGELEGLSAQVLDLQ